MKGKLKSAIAVGKEFGGGIGDRALMVYATSGCYYMFMSLVPFVMILCCILPYTPLSLNVVLDYISQYFAESLAVVLKSIANAVYRSSSTTLTVSIVLTLYSASASMKAIMKGMNSAYHVKCTDNFIVFSLRALLYMIVLIGTLVLSLVVMVYGGKILEVVQYYVHNFAPLGMTIDLSPLEAILSGTRYLVVMVILMVVFLILYKLMPSKKVRLLEQIPGAIFAAAAWVAFSSVFTIYLNISNKFGAYGFIGTIMVAMMWMYYCLFFMLIGGYINSFLADLREQKKQNAK